LQSARRGVVRVVGQQIAQLLTDIEENVISKARRALFGDDFAVLYDMLKNRLVFLDGGKDDIFFLEHYVLLGNYARDPDRFEAMDELFQDFLRDSGLGMAQEPAYLESRQAHQSLLDQAQAMRDEIANLEEQRESLRKRLDRGESFLNKFLSSADPADMKASLNDIESRLKHQETKLEESGPPIEAARQKLEFFTKDYKGKLGDFLNDPENGKRLFDQTSVAANAESHQGKLLAALLDRLEQQEIIYHVMSSYEIRPILEQYCPPVHLQQLRKDEARREHFEAGAGAAARAEADRGFVEEVAAVFARREVELCGAIHRRFLAAEARSAERRTPDDVHGARQPDYDGAGARIVSDQQQIV
jgi:hypothetical protein